MEDEKDLQAEEQQETKKSYDFKSIAEAVALIHELKNDLTKLRALKNRLQKENETLLKDKTDLTGKQTDTEKELEKLKEIETKYKEVEKQRRDELLKKLPEDKRDGYKDLDVGLLAKITTDFVKENEKVLDSIGGIEKQKIPSLDNVLTYEQLSVDQINDIAVKDPVKLQTMYREFLNRQSKGF